jgi:hypothetical protein
MFNKMYQINYLKRNVDLKSFKAIEHCLWPDWCCIEPSKS